MNRFVIVTPMKNEGPFILEWVAHNLAIGADVIAIFSNDCTDGSDALLDRLDEMGKLRHFDNSSKKPAPQRRDVRPEMLVRVVRLDAIADKPPTSLKEER